MNTAYFTVSLFSPAPNVIGVKFEHFRGRPKRGPAFEIASDPSTKPKIVNETDLVSLKSGDLAVRVEKRDDWRLDVLRGDKRITGSALGGSGYASDHETGRTYVFERLDLGVGDLVYGLGERFDRVHQQRSERRNLESRRRHKHRASLQEHSLLHHQPRLGRAGQPAGESLV